MDELDGGECSRGGGEDRADGDLARELRGLVLLFFCGWL